MAYDQRGSAAPRVVKLTFPTCRLLTTLYHDNPDKFATCAKCGVIPDFFHKLDCSHHLCGECATSSSSYTCETDSTTTEIFLPINIRPACNDDLKEAAVYCPGCSRPLMFGYIKAHIREKHPELWMHGNLRNGADNQARKPWMSNTGPTDTGLQTQAAMLFGGPHGQHSDNPQRPQAPPTRVHENPAGSAVRGPYQDQEALRASSSQKTYKDDVPAAPKDSGDVEMEDVESCWKSSTETAIADTEQRTSGFSSPRFCQYCCMQFQAEKLKEHQNMCGELSAKCWQLFRPEIFKYHQGKEHMGDGLLPSPEFKRLIRLVIREYYEQHLSKQCQGIRDGVASFEEHLRTCEPFFLKSTQFWTQDVQLRRDEKKQYIQCSTIEHTGQNFQAEAENSVQFRTGKPDEDAPLQTGSISKTVECPWCLTFWDVARIEDHTTNCKLWFAECRKLFARQIHMRYKAHLGDEMQRATTTGQILQDNAEDGLLSPSVCQKWYSRVMATLYQEHRTKPWQGIPKDLKGFKHFLCYSEQERLYKDDSFTSKCKELLNQVVLEYQDEHSKDQCLRNKNDYGSFQEDSQKSARSAPGMDERVTQRQEHSDKGTPAPSNVAIATQNEGKEEKKAEESPPSQVDEELREGKGKRPLGEPCPYCHETWVPEEFHDHLTSCEKQFFKCPECTFRVHKDGYQQLPIHACPVKQQVGSHVERTVEDNGGGTTTKDDIEDLKNKVEDLENRLEALERPLTRLIERLKNESRDKK